MRLFAVLLFLSLFVQCTNESVRLQQQRKPLHQGM
jgi:hypothetical protein